MDIEQPCVAVKIAEDVVLSTSITEDLLCLLATLEPIKQQRPSSNTEALQLIEKNLSQGVPQNPLDLFPREQNVTDWYYQIYSTARQKDDRAYHPILLEIFGRKRCPHGSVIIVKNGLNFIPDAPQFDIDINELGRTLWWYVKSGRDPVTEASERRLMHYIHQSA